MEQQLDAIGCGVESVIGVAQLAAHPVELGIGRVYAAADGGRGVKVIDTMDYLTHLPEPHRMRRSVKTVDAVSFIEYVCANTNYADEARRVVEVYAKTKPSPRMVAVFDANQWREDRVYLDLVTSPEWDAWTRASGTLVDQAQFADFIEDQVSTIVTPDGGVLLEVVQSMQAAQGVNWKSAFWLGDGTRQFVYEEHQEAKAGRSGQLDIPAQFTVGLRPFVGADPFEVRANLRYRINGGDLKIGFKLVEPERRLEAAVADVTSLVAEATGLAVLAGWPE
jgi:uncharacterized protein YfdQ (DUF2303 family)